MRIPVNFSPSFSLHWFSYFIVLSSSYSLHRTPLLTTALHLPIIRFIPLTCWHLRSALQSSAANKSLFETFESLIRFGSQVVRLHAFSIVPHSPLLLVLCSKILEREIFREFESSSVVWLVQECLTNPPKPGREYLLHSLLSKADVPKIHVLIQHLQRLAVSTINLGTPHFVERRLIGLQFGVQVEHHISSASPWKIAFHFRLEHLQGAIHSETHIEIHSEIQYSGLWVQFKVQFKMRFGLPSNGRFNREASLYSRNFQFTFFTGSVTSFLPFLVGILYSMIPLQKPITGGWPAKFTVWNSQCEYEKFRL